MAVIGRISGPLLARNLFRDNVPIAFYNINSTTEDPVLFLDVINTRVGIRRDTPGYPLDVKGTINGDVLRVVQTGGDGATGVGTIGKIFISTNTIASVVGPVNIVPAGGDDINLLSNVLVDGSLHATGSITADGDIALGNVPTDRLKFNAEIDSDMIPALSHTYNVGATTSTWAAGYFDDLITSRISNTTGPIIINPEAGLLEINGQIRVNSPNKPLGTAPVVTNILYVTMDGSDTNDGSAQDASRACRTISGATKSPLYGPGTSIKVAPGRFYEDNPIEMQPYTSIIGSDLRTTFVEPLNKTQDLFHVRSGCYIAQMQMSNGRSGLLPIENANGYNRGAYATAFPPSVNGEKIDIFQSPYIQNCTNQSGPWLKDGTMFIPNQTVQIPKGVARGTWLANTSTLVLTLSTGTIAVGDSINAGPQNLGFFDARTLLLANKPFIQEQVTNYINYNIATATTGSIWKNFTYSVAKCYRDVGILVENISYDTTFGGNEKSIESGLAYYNGVISVIAGQERQTIAAINYINTLTQRIITNTTGTLYGSVTYPQVINRNLTGGSIAGSGFAKNTAIVTGIIDGGYLAAPDMFKSSGPDFYTISAEVLLQANRTFIQDELVSYMDLKYSSINYDVTKCKRDLGLIVDSIGLDLLYPTTNYSQSTFTGLQYWNQNGYTGLIASELSTTTNAINYISSLAQEIVQNITTGVRYQAVATQVTNLTPGSEVESNFIGEEFGLIVDIISNGTTAITDRIIPNKGTPSTVASTNNAYAVLLANKSYIQAEAIAWVEQNKTTNFVYDPTLCERDVGYMIDSVAFDLLHGGNRQAIQSGVYYYSFNASSSAVGDEIPQVVYAYNTLTNLVSNIVKNIAIVPAQTKVPQIRSASTGTTTDVNLLTTYINNIVNIIQNGPTVVVAKEPITNTRNNSATAANAYALLEANREFIKEEVVARTNKQFFPQYNYNKDKCYRDSGLIADAVAQDLLFNGTSQSTFTGLQYWSHGDRTGQIPNEITTTTNAIVRAKNICQWLVTGTNFISQSTGTRITGMPLSTIGEARLIGEKFDVLLDILTNGVTSVTDKIVPNDLDPSDNVDIQQAFNMLQANKAYVQQEVVSYIELTKTAGFAYDVATCLRDVGYIVDSVSFDLLYSGNRQSIQSGVYYWGYDNSSSTVIYGQTTSTNAAFNRIRSILPDIIQGNPVTSYQDTVEQVFDVRTSNNTVISAAASKIDTITYLIGKGPAFAGPKTPIGITASTSTDVINAAAIIRANRRFIQADTIAYVDTFYAFDYDRVKSKRDTGYIIDAVTQDLILGGTTKAIEAGITYWSAGESYIKNQLIQCVDAVTRAKTISLDIIQNNAVTPSQGNTTPQVINTYFSGGSYATSQVSRGYDIILNIMQNGISVAPESYVGSGLFASTGISNNDTKIAPKVTSVSHTGTTYTIGIDRPTIGAANNATLYFGKTAVYPKLDADFTTQQAKDWGQRMIDPAGSMGGSLVDGGVVSARSPINSFVYDAFTQVNQGGRGIHIINNGYAQLVSVFTIFCSTAVEVDNGGIASITNSNSNFGDYCLVAKGKGKLEFQGTVYNPAYPTLAQTGGATPNGQYYPNGYWPQNAQMLAFIPDDAQRPHIGLVMEVIPPKKVLTDTTGGGNFVETDYINDQGLPGFLTAIPNKATLTTGTIKISDIDTDGIAIGQTVYVRDQYGSFRDNSGNMYISTGTTVTDVGFRSVTLSVALNSGGGEVDNPNFFTILFTGNAYYNVLSSSLVTNPVTVGNSMLPANINSSAGSHGTAEYDALVFMQALTINVIANNSYIALNNTVIQNKTNPSGAAANAFISDRFNDIISILQTGPSAAPAMRKTGTPPPQATNAILQLKANTDFIVAEVTQFTISQGTYIMTDSQKYKCKRDTALIIDKLILDLTNGGNYNSVLSGLSYYSRAGTYHLISLEDQVRNPLLFPDGSTLNFYQRSYMSALGYTFEYVGAGTNYGSLPQVGRADPAQDREVVQIDNGKVFFTSTDQNGDFRIGPGLVISQATGVLSGRTFTKSLFAQMTPFILAVEAGG
jgi:hypothetical protein